MVINETSRDSVVLTKDTGVILVLPIDEKHGARPYRILAVKHRTLVVIFGLYS